MELGGAEGQAISFAKYLKRNGYKVTILGLSTSGAVCDICEKENISYIILSHGNILFNKILSFLNILVRKICKTDIWPSGLCLMYALAKYIKKNDYDLCISYCSYANTILGFSKRICNSSLYAWFQRDAGAFETNEKYQKRAVHMVDYVFANSQSGKAWLRKKYGVEATLIYNGVSLAEPLKDSEEWMKILKVNKTDIVCTMIANLSGVKDHMSILRAWRLLNESNYDKRLILVFAGRFDDQYEHLYSYAEKHNLLPYVRFQGHVTDITGLLRVTSICVFGAISEGSPNGIIEPAMMGLPVVATDLPEIREIVAQDNYKYLFSKGDIRSAADNIIKLAEDAKLRRYLGEKNMEKASHMFSAETNFYKLISSVDT